MKFRKKGQAQEQAELDGINAGDLYFSIFNQSPDIIFLLGLDGKLIQANARAAELLGIAPAEFTNLTIHDLSADLELTNDILQRLLPGEIIPPYELALRKKNGELLPVEVHPSLVRDRDGAPLYILSIFRDISLRKKTILERQNANEIPLSTVYERDAAREAIQVHQVELGLQNDELRESQIELDISRTRYFYNLAPVGYCTISDTGLILDADLNFSRLLLQARSQLINERFNRFVLSKDQGSLYLFFKKLIEMGGSQRVELRMVKQDGKAFWAYLEAVVAQAETGANILRVVLSDISERKQADDDRSILLDNIQTQVWYLFDEYTYGAVNAAHAAFFGLRPEDLAYKNIADFIPRNGVDQYLQSVKEVFRTRQATKSEEWVRDASGTRRMLSILRSPILNPDGSIKYVVCSAEDITERMLAADALRESESRLRQITSSLREAVWLTDNKTHEVLYVNPVFEELWGRSCESLYHDPNSFLDVVHPEDQERATQAIPLMNQGIPFNQEFRIIRPDGSVRWIWGRTFPIRDETGQVSRLTAISEDITERKQAEDALRESQDLFSLFMHYSPIYTFIKQVTSTESRVVYSSENYRDLIGIPGSEMVGKSMDELFSPEFAKQISADDWAVVSSREVLNKDEFLNDRYFSTIKFPIVQGDKTLLAGYTMDITDRQLAEEALRESEWRNRIVSELMTDYIFIVDVDRSGVLKLRWASENMMRISGRTVAEATTTDQWKNIIHRDDLPAFFGFINQILSSHTSGTIECRSYLKSGAIRWIMTNAMPQLDENGKVVSIVGAIKDITERKQAEREIININHRLEESIVKANQLALDAEAANLAKSKFLANMSHEIRTPLNAILGFSQLLQSDPQNLSAQQINRIETINRSGEHLLALLNDILELSKIEAGKQDLILTTFNLKNLFGDLSMVFRQRAEIKQLNFEVEGLERLPQFIVADEQKLRQVLTNLLSNAVKFTDTGTVLLRAWTEARKSRLAGPDVLQLFVLVEDSGPGIAAQEMGKLFEVFEQAAQGRQSGQGSGLGLAISRRFARMMGGDLTVSSTLGQGSVFRLEIPVEAGSMSNIVHPDTHRVLRIQMGDTACKVLVVDDIEDNRIPLVELLGLAGFELSEASNGREAVAAFTSGCPQLILMDLHMPGMDGNQAIRQIRSSPGGDQVRIISLTASATAQTRKQTLAAGADDFLAKPFRSNELFEKIRLLTGVPYIYVDVEKAQELKSARQLVLTREMLESLPAGFRQQLRDAAIRGRQEYLYKLIEQFAGLDPEIADLLRKTVARFDYESLLQ